MAAMMAARTVAKSAGPLPMQPSGRIRSPRHPELPNTRKQGAFRDAGFRNQHHHRARILLASAARSVA